MSKANSFEIELPVLNFIELDCIGFNTRNDWIFSDDVLKSKALSAILSSAPEFPEPNLATSHKS